MHHVRQSLSPGQRMIVQIPSISPPVLQMLGFDVFIIHLSSLRGEGTRSAPLNYQILFLPVTIRQEARNMGDPGRERDGQGGFGDGGGGEGKGGCGKRERKRGRNCLKSCVAAFSRT